MVDIILLISLSQQVIAVVRTLLPRLVIFVLPMTFPPAPPVTLPTHTVSGPSKLDLDKQYNWTLLSSRSNCSTTF